MNEADLKTDAGSPAYLVPYEQLLQTWGHGWEETWLIGDDEEPERFDLEPCVWINGHIMLESGSSADARGDCWREKYGRRFGMRVWGGRKPPTEEQRKNTPWTWISLEAAQDAVRCLGAEILAAAEAYKRESKVFSGLIAEE